MQVNLHIITLFYTLYNKGVNSVASICGLQKHEEKNEKKIAKYLVVPNIGLMVKCTPERGHNALFFIPLQVFIML